MSSKATQYTEQWIKDVLQTKWNAKILLTWNDPISDFRCFNKITGMQNYHELSICPHHHIFFCNPLALSIVYQYFCSCSLQGFAGAATPREGRWLLRHEGSSWEMDVICFGRVGLWTIHQRKMVPTRHRVIVVDMFWGVFSGRTKMTGVLISIINNYTYCELPSIAFPVINSYEIGVMHGIMPGVLSFPSVTKRAVLHRELKGP